MDIVFLLVGIVTLLAAIGIPMYMARRRADADRQKIAELQPLREIHQREEDERKKEVERIQQPEIEARKEAERLKAKKPEQPITVVTMEVLVIGPVSCGKTQPIWTLQGKSEIPSPTHGKTMEEFMRANIIGDTQYAFLYQIPDIGGRISTYV